MLAKGLRSVPLLINCDLLASEDEYRKLTFIHVQEIFMRFEEPCEHTCKSSLKSWSKIVVNEGWSTVSTDCIWFTTVNTLGIQTMK